MCKSNAKLSNKAFVVMMMTNANEASKLSLLKKYQELGKITLLVFFLLMIYFRLNKREEKMLNRRDYAL